MKCKNCGANQPDNQAYCDQCGRKLAEELPPTAVAWSSGSASAAVVLRCANCQHENPSGSNFCEECGAAINALQSMPPSLPPTQVSPSAPILPPTQVAPSAPPISYPPAQDRTQIAQSGNMQAIPYSSEQPPTQLYGVADTGSVTQHYQRPTEISQTPRLVSSSGMTMNFKAGQNTWLIGREDPVSNVYPDVDLTPFDPGFTVSRRHAQLTVQSGQASLVSLTRTNWTKVNGQRLLPDQPITLQSGDLLEFAKVIVTFQL